MTIQTYLVESALDATTALALTHRGIDDTGRRGAILLCDGDAPKRLHNTIAPQQMEVDQASIRCGAYDENSEDSEELNDADFMEAEFFAHSGY